MAGLPQDQPLDQNRQAKWLRVTGAWLPQPPMFSIDGNDMCAGVALPYSSMRHRDFIDAVVILASSEWPAGAFGARQLLSWFAGRWPVYCVQPDGVAGQVTLDDADSDAIVRVHVAQVFGPADGAALAKVLGARGIKRPLIWIENSALRACIARLHPALTVCHVTEAHRSKIAKTGRERLESHVDLQAALAQADMVAADSENVADMLKPDARSGKPLFVLGEDPDFMRLQNWLDQGVAGQRLLRPSLNLLMLYDDRSTHVGTIVEHLEAFRKYSVHRVHFMPATGYISIADGPDAALDFSAYDAVIVHYSVRISVKGYLSQGVAAAVAAYRGPKMLFIQDEYERVENSRRAMETLGIDSVFTTVPLADIGKIYPPERFSELNFIPTLTGYVPEDPAIDSYALPIAERNIRIAYRGRALPHWYGALGREKYDIGVDVRRLAQERGLSVDIEVDETHRIYGPDWYRFVGSARAMLGTESGSNVFDFDGLLAALSEQHKDMPFEAFAKRFLISHEGLVHMNQISPKIFEAIRMRTALVLYEGHYSGVVRANEHYIPLAKDYSNIDEVLAKLEDVEFLEQLTERAYRDVIATGAYSYRNFISGVDAYISDAAWGRRRAEIVSVPMLALYGDGDADNLLRSGEGAALVSDTLLTPSLSRDRMHALGEAVLSQGAGKFRPGFVARARHGMMHGPKRAVRNGLRSVWRTLPQTARVRILVVLRETMHDDLEDRSLASRVLRPFWKLAPARLRAGIASLIS